jgi:hypothetical protein
MEQVGLESSVLTNMQNFTKSKLKKFAPKANAKKFLNCKHEVETPMTKAKIAILGGQEKYDELMKILRGETPFDANANKVLQEALKACNGFGQLVESLNSSICTKIQGDYRVAHQMQSIKDGHAVPQPGVGDSRTMGICIAEMSSMLKLEVVDKIYDLQAQNGIYYNDPAKTQVQQTAPAAPVVEIPEDPVDDAEFSVSFLDGDDSVM